MKKLFFLPVLLFLALTSCNDDEEEAAPPTLSEQIKGAWVTVNQSYKYYDENDQLLHEESEDTRSVFTFDGSNLNVVYDDGDTVQVSYFLSENGGADFVNLSSNGQIEEYKITSFDESAMTWESRLEEVPYDADTATIEISDHAIVTIDFIRQ